MSQAPATVLVVDDSPENRYAIRRYLAAPEFDVLEAETGSEGLEMAARDPDLILLDVHLPDINGFDVCRRHGHSLLPGKEAIRQNSCMLSTVRRSSV